MCARYRIINFFSGRYWKNSYDFTSCGIEINTFTITINSATAGNTSLTVLGHANALSTVVFSDRPLPLSAGPLNRSVLVVAVDTLDDVMPLIALQRDFLQTVGLAAAPEELLRLSQALGQAGVTRICALGAMTAPEAGWHHDGRFSLLDLVRMVDIEASAEREAERFTSYEV